jgi:hypothetical protein
MKNLFLDDCRTPKQVTWITLPLVQWDIVKSYNEFVEYLNKNGIPKRISLDHDLSYEDQSKIDYATFKEKTGYDCAAYLIEYCMKHGLEIPEYYVHSHNPVGAANIRSLLESYKRSLNID